MNVCTAEVQDDIDGSILALSYVAAQRTFYGYNDMADAKALLESIARSFGYIYGREHHVRVNTISQSPTMTTAGSGVKGMDKLFDFANRMSPLGNASADECADYCIVMLNHCHVSKYAAPIEPWIPAAIVCGSALLVIVGGLKNVSKICEKLVPFMGGAYILGCLYILACNHAFLIDAVITIFECAFTPKAAFGGAVGSGIMVALQFGCARGLFSNESGLGTAPLISSAAASKNPARQALVGMTGAFWCTVVICLMSGLVIVSTLLANPTLIADTGVTDGATLANSVFGTIPVVGTPVLMLGIICFAYSTILGWSYYGERVTTYLFGRRWVPLYIGLYICMGFLGGIGVGDVAWTATDIANALMAIPNIIMVFVMTGMVAKETQHYVYDGNIDEEYKEEIHTLEEKSAFLRKKA